MGFCRQVLIGGSGYNHKSGGGEGLLKLTHTAFLAYIFMLATPETVQGFEVDLCPNSLWLNLKNSKQNMLPQGTHTLCFMNGLFIAVVQHK